MEPVQKRLGGTVVLAGGVPIISVARTKTGWGGRGGGVVVVNAVRDQ